MGIVIGLVPGAIKIDQMRQARENAEAFHLRSIADLKRQLHDEQFYYMKQMAIYRHALGIRLVPPTSTDVSSGMTCDEEYVSASVATNGRVNGIRSWKPREDGRCYAEDAP
jgi:hypothetical protein